MKMTCEKCGESISSPDGKYLYYQGGMVFACKACAEQLKDEIKCARKVCAAVDAKKAHAVFIADNQDELDRFLRRLERTMKRIPDEGSLRSDVRLLAALAKSYVAGDYKEISYNKIVGAVATLLYVNSPMDIIPDALPGVGFSDDEVAVKLCMKMLHDDLEHYNTWHKTNAGRTE